MGLEMSYLALGGFYLLFDFFCECLVEENLILGKTMPRVRKW